MSCCQGNGECQCGKCMCKKEHYGQFCDICQNCGPLDCSKYTECVTCVYLGKVCWYTIIPQFNPSLNSSLPVVKRLRANSSYHVIYALLIT